MVISISYKLLLNQRVLINIYISSHFFLEGERFPLPFYANSKKQKIFINANAKHLIGALTKHHERSLKQKEGKCRIFEKAKYVFISRIDI